jgi:sporulation protein YabP
MAEERRVTSRHTVFLEGREKIAITGVVDVISFDEEAVYCETEKGVMILKGINFHVTKLNLDNGELDIEGEVYNITYEDAGAFSKGKSSFLGKIFR